MALKPVNQWVAAALAHTAKTGKKISQTKLAEELSKKLRREIDKAAVNKIVTAGTREVSADEMLAIEEITGFPAPSPYAARQIPVLDYVQAGKLTPPTSQIPVEDVPLLAFADLGAGDWFALKVQGSSMDRVSPEDSIVVVNKRDRTLVNGAYYIFWVRDEGTTYKRWNTDPEYLAPYSWDGSHKPIFVKRKRDLEVIGRVKRTLMDLDR